MENIPLLIPDVKGLEQKALKKGIKYTHDSVRESGERMKHYKGMVIVKQPPFFWLCIGHNASVRRGANNAKGYTLRDGYIEYIPILIQPKVYRTMKRWVAGIFVSQMKYEVFGKNLSEEERLERAYKSLDGISLLELSLVPHVFPRFTSSIVDTRKMVANLCRGIDKIQIQEIVSIPLLDMLNTESNEQGILSHFSWVGNFQIRSYEGIILLTKYDPLYVLALGHAATPQISETQDFSENGFTEFFPFLIQRAQASQLRKWIWDTLKETIYESYDSSEASRRWEHAAELLYKQPPVFFYVFDFLRRRLLKDKTKLEYVMEASLVLLDGRPLRDYPAQLL